MARTAKTNPKRGARAGMEERKPKTARSTRGQGGTRAAARREPVPQKGETYECPACGMEVRVTSPCRCEGEKEEAHFRCCGQEMQKA